MGCCCPRYYCQRHRSHCSCLSPYPYLCRSCWEWGRGEGPPKDLAFPTEVGVLVVVVVEGAVLLRARSRTRRLVTRPSSCLAQSP
jgi:hypothetical protein